MGTKLHKEPNYKGDEKGETSDGTELCNELSEIVELALQGGVFGISSQS